MVVGEQEPVCSRVGMGSLEDFWFINGYHLEWVDK